MKEPSHFYTLESVANKDGRRLIMFNMSYGYKKIDGRTNKPKYIPIRISTKYKVAKEDWDPATLRATKEYVRRKGKDLNNALARIEKVSSDQLSAYRNEHEADPTPETLTRLIEEKLRRRVKQTTDIAISDYIQKTISRRTSLPNSSSEFWKKGTADQYRNLASHLDSYQATKGVMLTFGSITEELYWDFFKTLNDTEKQLNGQYYSQSTMAKECKHLKAIFNCALEDDIEIGIKHSKKSLKIHPSTKKYETSLTPQQLRTVLEEDVSHSLEFRHARNYIVLSSFLCGLRIGDVKFLHELKPQKMTHRGTAFDMITTRIRKSPENKEELIAILPLLQPVHIILKENNGNFPSFPSEPVIRKNIKKFLKHLKFDSEVTVKNNYYLVDEVEVTKEPQHSLFTPHDCRRTFITNVLQLGVSKDALEPITHPKLRYKSILDTYDTSTLLEKAVSFIGELDAKKSDLFHTKKV